MRKSMKSLMAILFVTVLSCHLFAADGVVTFVKGKVEVKKGNSWVSLNVGDTVKQSDMINTGFQSEAKVKLMDNILYLGPVTRVTLDTLAQSSDTDKVNVYLTTGSVRSKVNRTDTKRVSYTVRTPIAVASVRGTDFSVNGDGSIECFEGKVAVMPVSQLKELVKQQAEDEAEDEDDEAKDEEDSEDQSDDLEEADDDESISEKEEKAVEDKEDKEEAKSDKEESKKDETKPAESSKDDVKKETEAPKAKEEPKSSSPATSVPELDFSSEAGLEAMENAMNLNDVGEVIETNQQIKVTNTNTTTGVKHTVQEKADKVLNSVTTESKKPEADETVNSPNSSINNITKPTSGSISVNINKPQFGSLDVTITLPPAQEAKPDVTHKL